MSGVQPVRWRSRKYGDRRTVRRFAWVPVSIGENRIWLEHYFSDEEFAEWEEYDHEGNTCLRGWKILRQWQ